MNLHVTEEERGILARLIHREMSDLGPEIRHTDAADYREELKAYRDRLHTLSDRLAAPVRQPEGEAIG